MKKVNQILVDDRCYNVLLTLQDFPEEELGDVVYRAVKFMRENKPAPRLYNKAKKPDGEFLAKSSF